jgi:hypothetical protein
MDSAIHKILGPRDRALSKEEGIGRAIVWRRVRPHNVFTALTNHGRVNRPGRCRPRNHCFTVISLTTQPRAARAFRNWDNVRPARRRYSARHSGSRGGNSFFRLISFSSDTTALAGTRGCDVFPIIDSAIHKYETIIEATDA